MDTQQPAHGLDAKQVEAEIARFWKAMTAKSVQVLEDFYDHTSSVFGTSAVRPEPGRLAATRRAREYFQAGASLTVSTSPVEVVLVGEAALASYTFTLEATKIDPLTGKAVQETIRHGRATQVFTVNPDGKLYIVHEHLSVAAKN